MSGQEFDGIYMAGAILAALCVILIAGAALWMAARDE